MEKSITPRLLTVIVTYNAMTWLDRCLYSVINSTIYSDIYIIDNASTDDTKAYIKTKYPNVLFYESPQNLGFGRANNIGLQYALDNHYDYVYLLNQDAWIMPDTFEKLIAICRKYPEYGILSPIQMQANGEHIDKAFLTAICKNKEYVDDIFNNRRGGVYEQNLVMAAHWLITYACLKKTGGFSPTYPHYGEDNNYAARVAFHGFKVGFTDCTYAIHDREYRMNDAKKMMYLFYIDLLVNFSNPNIRKRRLVFPYLAMLVRYTIKYKSFLPLTYFLKFIYRLKEIIKNYKISTKTTCAFLKNQARIP